MDLISREDAIRWVKTECNPYGKPTLDFESGKKVIEHLEQMPSAQPELPKQFMSDDCISRSELYKKVCEAEKLARERVLDTPSDSPFSNKLNPAYTRYSAQLNERTQFKHMIADARSVQPEQRWIPFKTRPLTEEEKEEHPEWDGILDCKLPDDGQRILVNVSVRGHESVQYDEFYTDDGSYLDSGYEIGTEATAWMPLPEPPKENEKVKSNALESN